MYFCYYFLFLKRFCLFIFRQSGRGEKEKERNINVWLSLMCPLLGTWPITWARPWLGTEPATLWFAGWYSIHWAKTARTKNVFFKIIKCIYKWTCQLWLSWLLSSHTTKGCRFHFQSGHIPRLWVWSLVGVHAGGDQSMLLSHIKVCFCLSLSPSSLFKINKHI